MLYLFNALQYILLKLIFLLNTHFTNLKYIRIEASLVIIFLNSPFLQANEHKVNSLPLEKDYIVSYPDISLSNITIVDTSNNSVNLIHELNKGPVVINFIFTSCTAICPILSTNFSQVQKRFNEINIKNLNLISFSIDPERDTPSRLKQYSKKFNAGDNWRFFTGKKTDMLNIEKIFDNYRGNKMNHLPYTFIRINKNSKWIRLKGFVNASEIINEVNIAIKK